MNNRELLELAALAAGYNIGFFSARNQNGFTCGFTHAKDGGDWNPLEDDGDALRLAVKLKLEIYHAWDDVTQVCVGYPNVGKGRTDISYVVESYKDVNILEATRRSIVRAAAEIGKSMKVD